LTPWRKSGFRREKREKRRKGLENPKRKSVKNLLPKNEGENENSY